MTPTAHSPWLQRFAVFTAVAVLGLIWVGGLVTSHGAGMAVPDWPTSYGYNMFYFPIERWVGGAFYEHTHRLLAAFIGLLTSVLAAWIWGRETRGAARWAGWAAIVVLVGALGHRGSGTADGSAGVPAHFRVLAWVMPVLLAGGIMQCFRSRGALGWLAMTAFFAVILQGILGGLRVVEMKDAVGILHATLAQLFLVLLASIALFTSQWWRGFREEKMAVYDAGRLRYLFAFVTAIIFVQLVLGASMRHQHAGLAIPDFPTAYGRLWPAMDGESISRYNQQRVEVSAANPITAGQVALQMTHRATALFIFVATAWLAGAARSRLGAGSPVARLTGLWFAVILLQVLLGAATIWTNKAADIATAHVAVGALSLVTGALISIVSLRAGRRTAGQGSERVATENPSTIPARAMSVSA
jgi:cytochrome c oxidase assembly protein subunit 15